MKYAFGTERKHLRFAAAFLRKAATLESVSLWVISIGVGLRVESFVSGEVAADGSLYAYAVGSWLETGHASFVWAEPKFPFASLPLVHLAALTPFLAFGGIDASSVRLGGFLISLVALCACYFLTRDLVGKSKALAVTALFSAMPVLILSVGNGYGENIFFLFFVVSVWALIKGVSDDRYFLVLGFASGGLLLTKQTIGPVFVVLGVAGFLLWRFHSQRRNLVRAWGTWACVLTIVSLVWLRLATSPRVVLTLDSSGGGLDASGWGGIAVEKLFLLVLMVSVVGWFIASELRGQLKVSVRSPTFALWAAVGAIFILGWYAAVSYARAEPYSPLFSRDNSRYIFAVYFPLMILATMESDFRTSPSRIRDVLFGRSRASLRRQISFAAAVGTTAIAYVIIGAWLAGPLAFAAFAFLMPSLRQRLILLLLVSTLLSVNSATATLHYGVADAARALDCLVETGDTVAIDSPQRSISFGDLYINMKTHAITVLRYDQALLTNFVVSDSERTYAGYVLGGSYPSRLEATVIVRLLAWTQGDESGSAAQPIVNLWVHSDFSGRLVGCATSGDSVPSATSQASVALTRVPCMVQRPDA